GKEKEAPGGGGGPGGSDGGLEELEKLGPRDNQNGSGFLTPETAITFGPASKTREHKGVFRFADATGQLGTKFLCKLDRRRWKGCGSPKRLKKLHLGRHTFAVKAVNQVGVWDDVPAKRKFKVVR